MFLTFKTNYSSYSNIPAYKLPEHLYQLLLNEYVLNKSEIAILAKNNS